jgi:hypothetical protein
VVVQRQYSVEMILMGIASSLYSSQ